jgi:two-component system, response regulator
VTSRLPVLLIVEDDPQLQVLLAAAAERTGKFSSIYLAGDGQEALDHVAEANARAPRQMPDFVLSDLSMPRVDGLQLLHELKRNPQTRDLPVAIITSSNRPNDREDSIAAGCSAFFQKPVRLEEMVTLIGSLPHICGRHAIVSGPHQ